MEWLIALIVGIVLGGIGGWFVWQSRARSKAEELQGQLSGERETRATLEGELRQVRSRLEEIPTLQQQLQSEREAKVASETKLEETRKNLEEQFKMLADAKKAFSEAFGALAGEALKSNNQAFLELAKTTFERIQSEAESDLEGRQKAIEHLVQPLKEALETYDKEIKGMEKERQTAYGAVTEQLKQLAESSQKLQRETGSLVTALRTPQVRGRWGEMTLRRAAELAGMSEYCDFWEQETVEGEEGRIRPDMTVNLPTRRQIVVDAKVPLQAFLDAASATNDEERTSHMEQHAQLVRQHMNQLGTRNYWNQFEQTPEFVVLFLPGESFFSAALEQDRTLIEDGMEKRVVLATPTTLIALLRAVAYGWRQEQLAKNAQEISDIGKQLYDRMRTFLGHFSGLGTNLRQAVASYNRAVGSVESRVLTSVRRFKELGAATGDEIETPSSVDEVTRDLTPPEQSEAGDT